MGEFEPNPETGLNLSEVANTMNRLVAEKEEEINDLLRNEDFVGSAEILELQQVMNEWSFEVGLNTNLIKTLADAMKSIVLNIQ